MNKITMGLAGIIAVASVSCKKNIEDADKSIQAVPPIYGPVTLPNFISSNRTLSSDTIYRIDGKVFVGRGATLTIPAGALLQGVPKGTPAEASALVILKGAKLNALGTAALPITFTSSAASPQPGDWGGIVLLGRATVNQSSPVIEGIDNNNIFPAGSGLTIDSVRYGGNINNDNSGTIRYTLIKFAGAAISDNNELNSLTCGGVGSATKIEYVESYYGRDDAFEFFGGTVNADHLVALGADDDSYDTDFGYSGTISYSLSILDSNKTSYSSNPNGIEADNDGTGTTASPISFPKFNHMTILGFQTATAAARKGLLSGAHFRRRTKLAVDSSIFAGFPTGVRFESDTTLASAVNFRNNIVYGFTANFNPSAVTLGAGNVYGTVGTLTNANSGFELVSPWDLADFTPWTGPAYGVSGVGYKGAFNPLAATPWTDGWADLTFFY